MTVLGALELDTVYVGDAVALIAIITPEQSTGFTYTWAINGFSQQNGSTILFTPNSVGIHEIALEATDGDIELYASLTLIVQSAGGGEGEGEWSIIFNSFVERLLPDGSWCPWIAIRPTGTASISMAVLWG